MTLEKKQGRRILECEGSALALPRFFAFVPSHASLKPKRERRTQPPPFMVWPLGRRSSCFSAVLYPPRPGQHQSSGVGALSDQYPARLPPPQPQNPQMGLTQAIAHADCCRCKKNPLPDACGQGINEACPGSVPLAGFQVILIGRI